MNNKYTLQDIAAILSKETGKSLSESERFLQEFLKIVSDGLCDDKVIDVNGMGTFELMVVEKSEVVSSDTGDHYIIPDHYKFVFSPDKGLKELVNRPFSLFETTELKENVVFDDIDVSEERKCSTDESEDSIEEVLLEPVLVQTNPVEEKNLLLPKNVESEVQIDKKRMAIRWKYLFICLSICAVVLVCFILFFHKNIESQETPAYIDDSHYREITKKDTVDGSKIVADTIGLSSDSLIVNPIKTEIADFEDLDTVSIKQGDRLTLLSLHYYGHKFFWVYIYEYNKAYITDPNNIPIGTRLRIPNAKKYGIDRNDRSSIEKAIALQSEILSGL